MTHPSSFHPDAQSRIHDSVKKRSATEKAIAQHLIKEILDAGYSITVNDGEEDTVLGSRDPEQILYAMSTTDEDIICIHRKDQTSRFAQEAMGWVKFVYGNSGYDVISDYTVNIEKLIEKTNAFAETLDV